MHVRSFKAVASCALAIACASAAPRINAAQWTSMEIGKIMPTNGAFGICLARLPDGRFVLGAQDTLSVQTTWGAAAGSLIDQNGVFFDPSFVAVKDATTGLLGEGGRANQSGTHLFNPSAPSTALVSTSLATLQNYCAVYWKHPTSGREGWLIGGANTSGMHSLAFVSADGAKSGAITGVLSTYSSGICVDAAANVYASLSEFFTADAADSEKVLKFTADQVDTAVAAAISGTPAPLAKGDAVVVHQFDSAASIAVDATNRVWAAGYAGHIQVYDPVTSLTRTLVPDHAVIRKGGAAAYQIQTFAHDGVNYAGFLANDSLITTDTSLIEGHKPISEITTDKAAFFAQTSVSKSEADGTVSIGVTLSTTPAMKLTVPFTAGGTAVKGRDYTLTQTSVSFSPTDASLTQNVTLKILNNGLDDATDNKTVILRLGAPTPAAQDFFADAAKDTCTLTITDDDHKPIIATAQNFIGGKVGTAYNYQVLLASGVATKFTASGLPPGMSINSQTGVISGTPTMPGEYDQIWITASNAAGVSTTAGYYIKVDDFAPAAHGAFVGLADRIGDSTSGLGGRLDLSVTKSATFTGRVTVGAAAYALSGVLDTSAANPTGGAQFTRNSIKYDVSFTINATSGAVIGSIVPHVTSQVGVNATGITGWKAQPFSSLAGLHNFAAPIPGGPMQGDPYGTSFGSITVLVSGSASVTCHAADGAVFSTSAAMGPNGEVLLYQTAYAVPGSLTGVLAIANDGPHTVTGDLSWTRPPQATGGWNAQVPLTVQGGKYRPVSGSGIVMNLPATSGNNVTLFLQDGGLAHSLNTDLHIFPPAVVSIPAPYKLTVTNSTGAFSGSFKNGAAIVPFQGVIVPATLSPDPFDGSGVGYFLTPGSGSVVTRSGKVLLSGAK